MFENLYFCCYFLNFNNFENFKYPQFVWSNNFTYDNSFIFHPQCHALASLFLNMPICEITVTYDFIFRLVLCSHEDVSFNSICLNALEGIKQFYLLMWFKKTRLETPLKGDNVNALVKSSNCENLVLYFSEKIQKIAAFAMLFLVFSD